MPVSINGNTGITFPDGSLQTAAASPLVLRNRIINGDMRIDQRNAGASASVGSFVFGYLSLDRYRVNNSTDGAFTLQQSTTAPSGFNNSLVATVTTADTSIAASQFSIIQQNIEGFNVADLGFGTAGASTITLSFWVRSSITGTFGGALLNAASDRSYPFSYTINSANTFEQKTITLVGDTSGTWLKTNGIGLNVIFSLAAGSTYTGTAGSWAGATYLGVTGQSNVLATIGNTFYLTGIQLEAGSTATPFERRLYNQELANCQRYFTSFVGSVAFSQYGIAEAVGTTKIRWPMQMPVTMRSTPTLTVNGSGLVWALDRIGTALSAFSLDYGSTQIQSISATTANGITVGQAGSVNAGNFTNTSVTFSSEL